VSPKSQVFRSELEIAACFWTKHLDPAQYFAAESQRPLLGGDARGHTLRAQQNARGQRCDVRLTEIPQPIRDRSRERLVIAARRDG
jgi:hypothetical protein